MSTGSDRVTAMLKVSTRDLGSSVLPPTEPPLASMEYILANELAALNPISEPRPTSIWWGSFNISAYNTEIEHKYQDWNKEHLNQYQEK